MSTTNIYCSLGSKHMSSNMTEVSSNHPCPRTNKIGNIIYMSWPIRRGDHYISRPMRLWTFGIERWPVSFMIDEVEHTFALFAWVCLADKPWLKVLLADLGWEKNIVRLLKSTAYKSNKPKQTGRLTFPWIKIRVPWILLSLLLFILYVIVY